MSDGYGNTLCVVDPCIFAEYLSGNTCGSTAKEFNLNVLWAHDNVYARGS